MQAEWNRSEKVSMALAATRVLRAIALIIVLVAFYSAGMVVLGASAGWTWKCVKIGLAFFLAGP